jgi:excisionase family DNA binding protein
VSDLAAALAAALDELRAELLEQLRAELGEQSWPAFMSVKRAAAYLDVSAERLRKLQARGEVPYHQDGRGCRVLFSRRDLDEWMHGQRVDRRERP